MSSSKYKSSEDKWKTLETSYKSEQEFFLNTINRLNDEINIKNEKILFQENENNNLNSKISNLELIEINSQQALEDLEKS